MAGRTVVLNRSSGSVNPMESPTAGVAVGYSQVSVLTDTLREDFYYYNRKEKDGAVPGFPGEFIFQNGKLRRHCIYENERMTKATYYTYQEREIMRLKRVGRTRVISLLFRSTIFRSHSVLCLISMIQLSIFTERLRLFVI